MAENTRLYIPAFSGLYDSLEPYALPVLRVVMGLTLFPHGAQKAFGWFGGAGFAKFTQIFDTIGYKPGALWVTIVMLTEMIGGLCLALGLFTRVASLFIAIFMVNAVLFTSAKGFFWTAGGLEYSLIIGIVALVFLIRGGGRYSLDAALGREF